MGRAAAGVSSYRAAYNEDGTITLTPMAEVPAQEVWLWRNQQALDSVRRGLAEAGRGEVTPLDLSALPDDESANE